MDCVFQHWQFVTEPSLRREKGVLTKGYLCSICMRSDPTVGSGPTKHLIALSFKHTSCLFNITDRIADRQDK